MEQDQQPFAIQLQRREMTLSQRNRPHPYLNSPNSGNNDSSGYSSGSSRPVSSRRSSSFEVNNLDQTTQNSQQSKQGFFEAYDCPRCGNIHRKGTVCQQIIEAYDCTRCGNIHRKGTVCNAVLSPSNSRPQSRDSYSSLGSGLSSGPLPALQLNEAPALLRLEEEPALHCSDEAEDHEMSTEIPESRPLSCQSEPLNLAVGIIESTRPPSRPMRGALTSVDLAVQEAQQAAAQGKARLPAKIRLKSQLSPTALQSSKPSLRVKKLKDLMSPNSLMPRKQIQTPTTPITPIEMDTVESEPIVVEPDQSSLLLAEALPSVSSAISNLSPSEKQQLQTQSQTFPAKISCDDLIDISDDTTENHNQSAPAAGLVVPHPVPTQVVKIQKSEISPTPAAAAANPPANPAATSVFVKDFDPKIEMGISMTTRPYMEIVEQPASNSLRFRYRCEGRSAGTLHGVSTTGRYSEIKTFPKVKIHGFQGPARVAVSCVEADLPYRCHPHNIVGKNCTKGICIVNVDELTMTATIPGIGIQCVKKKDMGDSLGIRKQIGIDPFKQGFEEIMNDANVNLNAIRLAFQGFLDATGSSPIPLEPLVTQVIKDKKAYCDLAIVDISDNWSPVEGGKKILLFSKKICRTDIEVHISYTNTATHETKTFKAPFKASDVHEQCGISFRTPPFPEQDINSQILTQLCLYKPTDFTQSEPVNFYYYPKDDSAEEFEPPSEDEGVDTSEMIENDEDDVVPMLQIDPRTSPCNEDYDNYDSERILQIDESIEEEAEESEPTPSNQIIKVVMDPRKPLTVDNVLKMRPHEISSLYSSNSGATSLSSSPSRKKKKFSEPVKETLKIKIKKPFNIKNSLPSMPILVDLEANDSGIGPTPTNSGVLPNLINNLDQMDIAEKQ